jgi:hypothetical protein
MRHRLLASAFLAFGLLLAGSSRADGGGNDEVTLKDGGTIRGTVVASAPGTSVKILALGEKTARVIPWSRVSDIEKGKYAEKSKGGSAKKSAARPGSAGPGYAAPEAPAAPEPTAGVTGIVKLHIESPVPAQVLEHVGTVAGGNIVVLQLEPVCASPCDRVIDGRLGNQYVLTGDFPTPSSFTLGQMRGDVTLTVAPGSTGRRVGGFAAVAIVAPLGLALGPLILSLAGVDADAHASAIRAGYVPSTGDGSGGRAAGVTLLITGGVALVGGIYLLATSGTKTKLEPTAPRGNKTAEARPRYWLGEF